MRQTRLISFTVGICLIGFLIFIGLSADAPAQDTLEDRVSALETQVSDQDGRIQALEEQISGQAGQPTPAAASPGDASSNVITLSGVGTTVSDKVELPAGRYKVTATVELEGDFDGFIVIAYVGDEEHYLFNEIIEESGTWTGSTILEAGLGGETFVEVSNTDSAWTLTFEPF